MTCYDNPYQFSLGVVTLFFAVLIGVLEAGDVATWESVFLFLLGLGYLRRYWTLTRSTGAEDVR